MALLSCSAILVVPSYGLIHATNGPSGAGLSMTAPTSTIADPTLSPDTIFGIHAQSCGSSTPATVDKYDPSSSTTTTISLLSAAGAFCNGRGLGFDGTNLWYTVVEYPSGPCAVFEGDGLIHEVSTSGGLDINTIPDPYGMCGRALGTLKFRGGFLWAQSYIPDPTTNTITFFKIDPATGAVLASCNTPFGLIGEGADSLAVDLGTNTFYSDNGEIVTNPNNLIQYQIPTTVGAGNCVQLNSYPKIMGMTGIDFDSLGSLIATDGTTLCNLGSPPFSTASNCVTPWTGFVEGLTTHTIFVFPPPTPPLKVTKFFTDSGLNPLALDSNGNPMVNVILEGSVVRSINPGQVLAWVNVTNTGSISLQSLKLNETLPVDWLVHPAWIPAKGAIHVYYANTTSLATNPEITDPSTITVSTANPEIVHLAIPDFNSTAIGHPLTAGQSILLSVKLSYGLKLTTQSATSYPRNYTDTANAVGWSQPSFKGSEATGTGSAFFIAYADVVETVPVILGNFQARVNVYTGSLAE